MKLHWKILIWMAAGIVVGLGFQQFLEAPSWPGVELSDGESGEGGAVITSIASGGPVDKINSSKARVGPPFKPGDVITGVVLERGQDDERLYPVDEASDFESLVAETKQGNILWTIIDSAPRRLTFPDPEAAPKKLSMVSPHIVRQVEFRDGRTESVSTAEEFRALIRDAEQKKQVAALTTRGLNPRPITLAIDPSSPRAQWLRPFSFVADLFMRLLKMLIVPLVLTSIITGVSGLGSRDFGRLGTKTLIYYVVTSFLAASTGLLLVNLIGPGKGAKLGLGGEGKPVDESLTEVFLRMIPENVFEAFSTGNMLQIIFFAILFGYFITRVGEREGDLLKSFFSAAFEVMMKLAGFALALVPYGVFCLVVKVMSETGLEVFVPLLKYMLTVFLGLVIHMCITLPLLLSLFGVNPIKWVKAMSPALLTAFSTSSSAMTLPVTLESVETRGGVSNRTSSFVLPLGATVNMDGTAIYECVGVIFLAQYYATASGGDGLTFGTQIFVVLMALLASIGAAGIPSAGIVMMFTILTALGLPLEGAALLLAVDRPLDMCRTMTNIFSDSCGTAIIAKSEGEAILDEAKRDSG